MAMMKRITALVQVAVLVVVVAAAPAASAGPKGPGGPTGGHGKAFVRGKGEPFCPAAPLVYGEIVIPAKRCYVLSVLRDSRGTFLAFVPPDAHIPPGQLVRLNTPAGPKLKVRMFLVPIQPAVALVPVDTFTLVAAHIEDSGPRLTIVLVGTPVPNLTVVFGVQL